MRLFRRKTPLEKLDDKYQKLLQEAHKLSTVNRAQSDAKMAEANEVLKQIEQLSAS